MRRDRAVKDQLSARPVSVVIPVLNQAGTIACLVRLLRKSPRVREVIVVDDGSMDGTPEIARQAGASVMMSSYLGRGASIEDGLQASRGEVVLVLDGDLADIQEDLVETMIQPLLTAEADVVRARSTRETAAAATLTARPLLSAFFPELDFLEAPLGGTVAARRSLLAGMKLEKDYGVDIGLLIDAAMRGAVVVEVESDRMDRGHTTSEALSEMADQVTRVILDRAWRNDRLSINHVRETEEADRRAKAGILTTAGCLDGEQRYALLEMDGVLLDGRFAVELAERVGAGDELARFLDNQGIPAAERAHMIAALFVGVSKEVFEDVALSMPLAEGAAETVVALRRAGYRVGIISDDFQVAADVVRHRVFADFSVAHLLRFRNGVSTGELELSLLMLHPQGCPRHQCCKANVLTRLAETAGLVRDHTLVVGNELGDICLLREAGLSVAFRPKSKLVSRAAKCTVERSLRDIIDVFSLDHAPRAAGRDPRPPVRLHEQRRLVRGVA